MTVIGRYKREFLLRTRTVTQAIAIHAVGDNARFARLFGKQVHSRFKICLAILPKIGRDHSFQAITIARSDVRDELLRHRAILFRGHCLDHALHRAGRQAQRE